MTNVERQVARLGKFSKVRPAGVRDLKLSGSKLTWVEPTDTKYVTHYYVRVGTDQGNPAYQVPVGQTSCVVAGGDTDFWVSAANKTMGTESPMVLVKGTATGGGGSGAPIGLVTGLTASASTTPTDGELLVTVSGTLPTDASLAGLRFIVERPSYIDPFPANLTLPGDIQNTVPDWYTKGDGNSFSQSFVISKPSRLEKCLIYVLSFSEGYENELVRLTQHTPPLPVGVTPYAVLDITTSLTVAGSELTDITLTGTPTLTPTVTGQLKVNHLYVPPYLAGPLVSIGDFQGVTVWYQNEDGELSNLGDQPYLPPVAYDATPPDNLGSINATVPMPASGATVYFVICSYSTSKHLPFRDRSIAPPAIVIQITIDDTTSKSGLATQVSTFSVSATSEIPSGVNGGVKQGTLHITYTAPADTKWKGVWIDRITTSSSHVPLGGATWSEPVFSNTGKLDLGPWPWPKANEYYTYRARSVNFDDEVNDFSAPQAFINLLADGTFQLANNTIAAAMLQDLAVEARALADYAVTTTKYAPLSIVAAAIGIAAINDANIANLNVNKLTGNSMSLSGALTIAATGGIVLNGYSGSAALTIDLAGLHGEAFYGDVFTDNIFANTGAPITFHSAFDFSSSGDASSVGAALLAAVGAASGTPTYFFTKNGSGVGYHVMDLTDILNAMSLAITGGTSGKYLQNNGSGVLWADPEAGMGSSATVNPSTLTSITILNGRITAYA